MVEPCCSPAAALVVPLAVLDAVQQEEVQCRERFMRIADDFLALCFARLHRNARVVRLMAREEAIRSEIYAFFSTWSSKAGRLASRNNALVHIIDRNVFRLRAKFFAKWIRYVVPRDGQEEERNLSNHHVRLRESSMSPAQLVLLRIAARCTVFSVLRLPPMHGDAAARVDGDGPWGRFYKTLDILTPSAEDTENQSNQLQSHSRADVLAESSLLSPLLRVWASKFFLRRKTTELFCRESAKRKLIVMFEASERVRNAFQ